MKKIKYLIFMLGIMLAGISSVSAASLKMTTNKTTVVVGNSVSITVSVSGSDADGWEYCVNYDSSKFTLTNRSSSCVLGSIMMGNKSVTFKFKAKASGTSTFSLKSASILDENAKEVLKSKGSVTIKAKTQAEIEANYSTNANLNNLRVVDYDISPSFNKNVLKYTLEVENNVEKITIKATKADNGATVSGTGEKELSEGINKFEIVVIAEKGNKKVYEIEVNRKELNPINVDIDGFKYTVVRKKDAITAPNYYTGTTVELDGEKVPAFHSDITNYILIGLKDEEGNVELYRYDSDNNSYELYVQVETNSLTFIPLVSLQLVKGYEDSKNLTINEENVKVYTNGESEFVLVYGMNASNGKSSWYKYDTVEGTFQRYEEIQIENKDSKNLYFILVIVFASLSGAAILIVILLLCSNSKIRKKNKKMLSMLEAIREVKKSEKEKATKRITKKKDDVIQDQEEIDEELERTRIDKELQAELRRRQEEFLETTENEIVSDDVELEDVEEEEVPKKTKRGRKKSK